MGTVPGRSTQSLYGSLMSIREILGMALVVVALVVVPVAWIASRWLWMVSFFALVLGVSLFFSARNMRRLEESEKMGGGSSTTGTPMPTDVHNYTGWRSGGRSETMDSEDGE